MIESVSMALTLMDESGLKRYRPITRDTVNIWAAALTERGIAENEIMPVCLWFCSRATDFPTPGAFADRAHQMRPRLSLRPAETPQLPARSETPEQTRERLNRAFSAAIVKFCGGRRFTRGAKPAIDRIDE